LLCHGAVKAGCSKEQRTAPREAGIVENNCNQKGGKEKNKHLNVTMKRKDRGRLST